MKIGVISDIHANLAALEATLLALKDMDYILCSGDLVGYLGEVNEVIELIRKHNVICIQGNHDQKVLGQSKLGPADFNALTLDVRQANASLIYTRYTISDDNLLYISNLLPSLTLELNGKKITMLHGSIHANNEYVYEDNLKLINETLANCDSDIIISGHTHLPFIYEDNSRFVVNSGSVGRIKDGTKRSSYLIIDLATMAIELNYLEYDLEKTILSITRNPNINPKLMHSLQSGT